MARILLLSILLGLCTAPFNAWASPDIEVLKESTVRVVVRGNGADGTGSGFVVSDQGHIITNDHVISGGRKFSVILSNTSAELPATLIATSQALDVAILRVEGLDLQPLTISSQMPDAGEQVWAIGYPGNADRLGGQEIATVTNGVLSKSFSGSWGGGRQLGLLQHSAQISPGNSGGPLFDDCGRVIGVNTQGSGSRVVTDGRGRVVDVMAGTGIFFASDSREAIAFLASHGQSVSSTTTACTPAASINEAALQGEVDNLQRQIEQARADAAANGQANAELIERLQAELISAQALASQEAATQRKFTAYALLAAAAGILLAMVLALRGPRKQLVQTIDTVSRRLTRQREPKPDRSQDYNRGGGASIQFILSYQDKTGSGQKNCPTNLG